MSSSFDVVIVGNGALGHATARALISADPSLKVAVVGQAHRPTGASPASGAMLGTFGEVTAPLIRSHYGRTKVELAVRASHLWDEWVAGLNAELPAEQRLEIKRGTFVINNNLSGQIEDENYSAIIATLRKYEEKWEEVDPTAIPGLQPAADSRPLRALFIPREGTVDSGRLLAAYGAVAGRSQRLRVVEDGVRTLRINNGKVEGVETLGGEVLNGSHVVLAAGIGTQGLLDQHPALAQRIPRLFAGGGTSVLLEADVPITPHVVRTPNRAFACGLHAVPRSERTVYVGATNHITPRPFERANVSDMYFLLECAMDQLHQGHQSSRLVTWNSGNRPVSIDGCPLIGPTSVSGLWMLTGTYRDGLHLSPLLAQDMARRILGREPLYENLFAPERQPICTRTREEAIEEGIRHYEAVGYEHRMTIPRVGWHVTFQRMYRNTLASVYDALESDYVIPPEFVPMIDNDRKHWVPFLREYYRNIKAAHG